MATVGLRPMTEADLPVVEAWLRLDHIARWWTPESTPEEEVAQYARCISGADPTIVLMVEAEGRSIGWSQWYRWADYAAEAEAMDALPGEVGFDYAIGDPRAVGRGLGTEMIAALVRWIRAAQPQAGLLVAPEAGNAPSRRVLEKNGFQLVSVRPVSTEPHQRPMAIYRLEG